MKKIKSHHFIIVLLIAGFFFSGCATYVSKQALKRGPKNIAPSVSAEVLKKHGYKKEQFCEEGPNTCITYIVGLRDDFEDRDRLYYTQKMREPKSPWQTISLDLSRSDNFPEDNGTIILIHGYQASKESLVLSGIYFRFLGYNVIIPDLLGSGESEGEHPSFGITDAEILDALVNDLRKQKKITGSLYIVANSMGAVAATHLTMKRNDVDGLILQAPMLPFSEAAVEFARSYHPKLMKLVGERSIRSGALKALNETGVTPDEVDISPMLKNLDTPVLILASKKDTLAPYAHFKDLSNKRISVAPLEERSHIGMAIIGDEDSQIILSWLLSNPPKGGIKRSNKKEREAAAQRGASEFGSNLSLLKESNFPVFSGEKGTTFHFEGNGDSFNLNWEGGDVGYGFATAITEDGYLITAADIIKDQTYIIAKNDDHLTQLAARLVAKKTSDESGNGFAIIHASTHLNSPLKLGELDPDDSRIYAFAYDRKSKRKLIALGGQIDSEMSRTVGGDFSLLPTNLPLHRRDTGGAVLTAKGQLVGVVTRPNIEWGSSPSGFVCIPDRDLILSIIEKDRSKLKPANISLKGTQDHRILVNAKINDQPVTLVFDTGAERTALFTETAKRLGLNVEPPPPDAKLNPGEFLVGNSEECQFSLSNDLPPVTTRLAVFDMPTGPNLKFDGLLAWGNLRKNILHLKADSQSLSFLKTLPADIDQWTKWDLDQSSRLLYIKPQGASQSDGFVFIDMRNTSGVSLNTKRWKDWRSKHKDQPMTLSAEYMPGIGLKVREECWAEELPILAELTLPEVPVSAAPAIWDTQYENRKATLNFFALTRLDVIIDGKGGHFYFRPIQDPTSTYRYNRLGAVFVPNNNMSSNDLVGHILKHSPADNAGIRDGDILLSIDDLDVTKWRTDPAVLPLRRFWESPAGTKLELSLTREGIPFKTTVKLSEIFPQSSTEKSE